MLYMMMMLGKTSPSSLSMEARVLATSSESRLSASLGDLATKLDIMATLAFVLNESPCDRGTVLSGIEFVSPWRQRRAVGVGVWDAAGHGGAHHVHHAGGYGGAWAWWACGVVRWRSEGYCLAIANSPWSIEDNFFSDHQASHLPERVYASFCGLITLPWNQPPSRAKANVAYNKENASDFYRTRVRSLVMLVTH